MSDRSLILEGDCLERMAELEPESVHAVVTDPPYGIRFMGQAWDGKEIEERARRGHEALVDQGRRGLRGLQGRKTVGFANRASESGAYDFSPSGMVAFQAWTRAWAAEALRILTPGGHLLSFASARTYHRMVCGIEEAGFEIRDQLLWLYGSGFPKALDVSKAIDKLDARDERRRRDLAFTEWMRSTGIPTRALNEATQSVMGGHYTTAAEQPTVPTAEHWALIRPLLANPIPEWVEQLVAEREVESENFKLRDVVGEREAPDARVVRVGLPAMGEDTTARRTIQNTVGYTADAQTWEGWATALKPAHEPIVMARKPLAGSVADTVAEHGTGALNIDATRVGRTGGIRTLERPKTVTGATDFPAHASKIERLDAGRWPANVLLSHLPECRGTTAAHTEKLCAPGCPVAELNEASGFSDSGAARFFFVAKTSRHERIAGVETNLHPTVKPIMLMRWLIRLVTPPDGVVLDPFLGSGSTGCAAAAEHVRFVGIEREPEYLAIARPRIADWLFSHPGKEPA